MLALVASLVLSLPTFAAENVFMIVSDVDDTVRISNTRSFLHLDLGRRVLTTEKFFPGMRRLYQSLLENQARDGIKAQLVFVSASPTTVTFAGQTLNLQERLQGVLSRAGFSWTEVVTAGEGFPDDEEKRDYKFKEIHKRLSQSTGPVLLLGDDTERDPIVYQQLMEEPAIRARVLGNYIHRITNDPQFHEIQVQTYWGTAFDLAILEHGESRISEAQAVAIGREIVAQDERSFVVPRFQRGQEGASCKENLAPKCYTIPRMAKSLVETCDKVAAKVAWACRK
jgi:hypothetical protein